MGCAQLAADSQVGKCLTRPSRVVLSGMTTATVTQFPWMRRSEPLQGTASAAKAIARVRYTHDSMIDMLIANPALSQNEIAEAYGFTTAWVSRVMNSDAFQARLAARKADIVDPALVMSIEEKLRTVASKGLDKLIDHLHFGAKPEFVLEATNVAVKALGYGARQQNVNVQQNFVVALPQKIASEADWAAKNGPGAVLDVPGAVLPDAPTEG